MDVVLTPDQGRLIAEAIASGRLRRREDAVREALALWESRERERRALRETLDSAEAWAASSEATPATEAAMQELAGQVKRRGRERLAIEGARRG
jgi:Arc/MetJ-type ribon-helix-helix transcriptional regulator